DDLGCRIRAGRESRRIAGQQMHEEEDEEPDDQQRRDDAEETLDEVLHHRRRGAVTGPPACLSPARRPAGSRALPACRGEGGGEGCRNRTWGAGAKAELPLT